MNARQYLSAPTIRLDELYHDNSKHSPTRLGFATAVQVAERDRTLHAMYKEAKGRHKTYAARGTVTLPRVLIPLSSTLEHAIVSRRSERAFGRAPLTLLEVATLFARSYGTCGTRQGLAARAVPSGGGLYPLDLYLLQFADQPIDAGTYHYHVGSHVLQQIVPQCSRDAVEAASIYPQIVGEAGMVLVVVADMQRARVKYGERSYRLVLLETGHVSQNLYLIATALGIGVVALDGFYDDRLHSLLDLDGVNEIALLSFAFGRRP